MVSLQSRPRPRSPQRRRTAEQVPLASPRLPRRPPQRPADRPVQLRRPPTPRPDATRIRSPNPMRIRFYAYFYPPCVGGGEVILQHQAEELVRRGHEVHVHVTPYTNPT